MLFVHESLTKSAKGYNESTNHLRIPPIAIRSKPTLTISKQEIGRSKYGPSQERNKLKRMFSLVFR